VHAARRPNHRDAQQRIGTDEVHSDGRGPSPLNSVFNTFRGHQQTDCLGRASFLRLSNMDRPSTQVRHPIPVGAAGSSNQVKASWSDVRVARPGFPQAGSSGLGDTARLLPWAKATGARGVASPQPVCVPIGRASGSPAAQRYGERVSPVQRIRALSNNGLHQTGRGGVAFASRRGPVVEARPAGEPGCSTGAACPVHR
jgi:hypothetical protein